MTFNLQSTNIQYSIVYTNAFIHKQITIKPNQAKNNYVKLLATC